VKAKLIFQQPLFQFSVSHDLSENYSMLIYVKITCFHYQRKKTKKTKQLNITVIFLSGLFRKNYIHKINFKTTA